MDMGAPVMICRPTHTLLLVLRCFFFFFGSSLDSISHVPYEWVMSHVSESCSHSHGTWLTHMGHDSLIGDMTHSYGTWLIESSELPAISCSFVCDDFLYIWVSTGLMRSPHNLQMTPHFACVHKTQVGESCHTYECAMTYTWMSHATHENAACHTYEWVMSHI